MKNDINIHPNYFDDPYKELLTTKKRMIHVFGSAGSGKSWSVFNMVPLWAMEGRNVLAVRKVASTIETSIWSETLAAISSMGITQYFKINKSSKIITCRINGRVIMFKGLDDKEKLKSIRSPNPYAIDTVICEEATELTPEDIDQLLIRQRGKKTLFKKRIFLLYNPIVKSHWIYNRYFKNVDQIKTGNFARYETDKLLIIKTTYKDNTHMAEEDIQTLLDLKETSPLMYAVYALGAWGIQSKLVYEKLFELPTDLDTKGMVARVGIDYGGIVDPNTCTISLYDSINKKIYVLDSIEHIGMSFEPFAEMVVELLKKWKLPKNQLILTDSSDTRADEILKQYRLNIKHTIKGPGSKMMHLKWMLSRKIYYDHNNTVLKNAFESYSWKKNRHGEYTNDTNHDGSDPLDALRYSFVYDMTARQTTFGR